MQILSVSEAGWPSNPLESAWSNSVRITFPADLSSDSAVESIVSQNREDLAKIALEEDLNAKGIDQHLASSFTANEQYFGHTAAAIASGFLSENQTPIDLFAKLTQMQGQLDTFNEILRRAQGKLKVTLIDDQGNVINLVKDTLNRVFAGYYSQEVSTLDDPRGAIVSKTFFISLENVEQTTLQLIARVTGNRGRMVKQSENPGFSVAEGGNGTVTLPGTYTWLDNSAASQSNLRPTYLTNDGDYNLQRKYDLTPILLINPEVQSAYGQDKSLPPFQSAQNKNQFIYSRFKDVSSEEEFYNYVNPEIEYVINLDTAENFYGRTGFSTVQTAGEFVWGGGFENDITPTTAAVLDDSVIEVHIEHPIVAKYEAFKAEYEQKTGDGITLAPPPAYPFNCTSTGNSTADVLFRQSKFAPLKSDDVRGKQQNIYLNENLIAISQIAIDPTLNYPSFGNPNMETPDGSPQVFQPSPSLAANTNLINVGVDYGRNTKNSFDTFDQYLLGKPSCGSYLFLSTEDHVNIQVDGDATTSFKPVQFGSSSALTVPLVFQYRMTDYFGDGSGVLGGLGNVGGDTTGATTNITYAKRVGFDVYPNNLDVFQYDIEVFSKYRPDGLNIDVFPTATLARGLNDLERVVSTLAPSITETAVNQQVRGEQGFTRRST